MEVKKKKKEKGERDTQFYYVCWISSFVIPLARSAVFVVGISICLFFPLSLPMSDLLLISTQTLCEEKLVVVLTLPVYFSLCWAGAGSSIMCRSFDDGKKDVKNKYEFRYWVGFVRGRQGKKARLLPLFEGLSADKLNCSDTTLHDELSSVCCMRCKSDTKFTCNYRNSVSTWNFIVENANISIHVAPGGCAA